MNKKQREIKRKNARLHQVKVKEMTIERLERFNSAEFKRRLADRRNDIIFDCGYAILPSPGDDKTGRGFVYDESPPVVRPILSGETKIGSALQSVMSIANFLPGIIGELPSKEDWVFDEIGVRGVVDKDYLAGLATLMPQIFESRSAGKSLLPRGALKDTPYSGIGEHQRRRDRLEIRRTATVTPISAVIGERMPSRTYRLCDGCYNKIKAKDPTTNPETCSHCKEIIMDPTINRDDFASDTVQLKIGSVRLPRLDMPHVMGNTGNAQTDFLDFLDKHRAAKESKAGAFNANFFFCPVDTTGLEKLTVDQRIELLQNQGNYMVCLQREDPSLRGDLISACENARIPTHRKPGVEIPTYGNVPFDFSGLK